MMIATPTSATAGLGLQRRHGSVARGRGRPGGRPRHDGNRYGVIFTSVPPAPLNGLFFGVLPGRVLKFDV